VPYILLNGKETPCAQSPRERAVDCVVQE